MQLSFSGGAMEIGGSCIYLRIDGRGILLDSGIRQGVSKDPLPDFSLIQSLGGVDAIVVSHAHMDHTGTLPIISKSYPKARIYMTTMSADLVRVLLFDSLKLMDRREDEIPHYAQNEVIAMLNRIHPLGFQMPFAIFEDLTLTLYPAGHIAGAACIYLAGKEGSLFYSGDFCAFLQKTIEGIRIPRLRPDAAIIETTYGNRLHGNRQVEEQRLIRLVETHVRAGHKILIPTFALGRSQEVLLLLKEAIQNGQIPAVPVYVDGMVRDINRVYEKNPVFLRRNLARSILKGNVPFYTKEITPVSPDQNREELLAQKGAAVFVSSSGMLTGGPSVQYAKKIAAMEEGCIIITGYQDEEAPGRKLASLLDSDPENPERRIVLDGTALPVRCEIARVGLSAHADQNELEALLERISPRDLFLVHGDSEVIRQFGQSLLTGFRYHVYLPECGSTYELNYRNKRRQLDMPALFSMRRTEGLAHIQEKTLWEYVREHYPQKDLTCAQLAFIWSGKQIDDDRELGALQAILLSSIYFTSNPHRLFLFRANDPETVEQKLAPREWTNQELEAKIQSYFLTVPYKKISYYSALRRIMLTFDYPDAIEEEDFSERAECFLRETGWIVERSPAMNHTAAVCLLRSLFGERLKKVSYFESRKTYQVQISPSEDADRETAQVFFETCGWRLEGADTRDTVMNPAVLSDFFYPAQEDPEPVEQNMALFCLDQSFTGQKHLVYKKSIKTDSHGKYLELAFISPEIGRQYQKLLRETASQLQWRLRIADSVNQNELFRVIRELCGRYGISLKQNPSYLPAKRAVQIKLSVDCLAEGLETVQKEFTELTGLTCMAVFI